MGTFHFQPAGVTPNAMLDFLLTEDMLAPQVERAARPLPGATADQARLEAPEAQIAPRAPPQPLGSLRWPRPGRSHVRGFGAPSRLKEDMLAQISPIGAKDFGLESPGQLLSQGSGESPARKEGAAWPKE